MGSSSATSLCKVDLPTPDIHQTMSPIVAGCIFLRQLPLLSKPLLYSLYRFCTIVHKLDVLVHSHARAPCWPELLWQCNMYMEDVHGTGLPAKWPTHVTILSK